MILNQSLFTPGCIQCGSFMVEQSLFCSHCFHQSIIPVIEGSAFQSDSGAVYLIEWGLPRDIIIRQLVYRLKAMQSPHAIAFYTDLLAEKLTALKIPEEYEAFVPVPGSSPGRIHAELIAKRLSQRTELKTVSLLERKPEAKQQKKLTGFERSLTNPFRLREPVNEEITSSRKPFIFVDDVMTTGQSIKHAANIVGTNKPNAVATLFYRPSICN